MTFDTHSGVNVDIEFGGCVAQFSTACTSWSNKTWTFNGTSWTNLSPSTSPSGRTEATLAYDPHTNTSVLFGGENASGALSDTWVWNGTTWTQSTGSTHPSARYGAVMAYSTATQLVYLFGGQSSATHFLSDTWAWNGTSWTKLTLSTHPAARAFAAMANDATAGGTANDLVLYGGKGSSGLLSDTWSFNGTTWTEKSLTRDPGPLENAAFSWDPTLGTPILYGGNDGSSVGSYWAWNGTSWLSAADGFGVGLTGVAMAPDPDKTTGQLVIDGGSYQESTWTGNVDTLKLDYFNAEPTPSTALTHKLDVQLTESVNPVDTMLNLQFADVSVKGGGLTLELGQNFSYAEECISDYTGCASSAGLLDVAAYAQPDGKSVLLVMPNGTMTYCPWKTTSWSCPGGSGITYNGTEITEGKMGLTYTLNSHGVLAKVANRNGNTITLNYTATHPYQAKSITDAEGRTTTLGYTTVSGDRMLSSITDPLGRTVTFTYDLTPGTPTINTVTVAAPGGATSATTTLSFATTSTDGMIVTTPAGRKVQYIFTTMNRLCDINRMTNTTTRAGDVTDISESNQTVLVDNPDHNTTTYAITGNEITKVTDPLGHTESASYNATSDPSMLTNDLTEATYLGWNAANDLTSVTAPPTTTGDTPVSYAYSYTTPTSGTGAVTGGQYLPSSYTTGENDCTSYIYDSHGNLTTTTPGLTPGTPTGGSPKGNCSGTNSSTVKNAYEGDAGVTSCGGNPGALCSTTLPGTHTTKYSYDSRGDPTTVTQPGGDCTTGTGRTLCTTVTYNADSDPVAVTDGKGQTTTYKYNEYGQVTKALYGGTTTCTTSSGKCVKFTYDLDGNVTKRTDKSGATTYVYDTLGRLVGEELPGGANACSGTTPKAITYTYDPASNLTKYCDAGGKVTYSYDAANRMIGVATGTGSCAQTAVVQPCTTYGYNTINEVKSITYPTSTGWSASLTTYTGSGRVGVVSYSHSGSTVEKLTYTYKKSGTIDVPLLHSFKNSVTGVTTTYTYSAKGQLDKATTGTASTTDTFAYNNDGDMTKVKLGSSTTKMAYNADNELCWTLAGTSTDGCATTPTGAVTYTYDADGNQTGNSAGESITYNSLNQTTSLTPAGGSAETFTYTGVGSFQRTSAGGATLTNSAFGVANRTTGSTTTYFTWTPSGRLNSMLTGTSLSTSKRYYYLYDGIGNVIGLISSTGTRGKGATYSFSPYGTTVSGTGTEATVNPFRYEEGYTDTTGDIHFGDRYLNPQLGTWTQPDPKSAVQNYHYAGDDPINRSDPTGLTTYATSCETGATNALAIGALDGSDFSGFGAVYNAVGGCLISVTLDALDTAFTTTVFAALGFGYTLGKAATAFDDFFDF